MSYTPKLGEVVRVATITKDEYRPAVITKLVDPTHAHLWCFKQANDSVGFIPGSQPGEVHDYLAAGGETWTPGTWCELAPAS